MGSMSIVHWIAVLLVIVLVFGTRKLGSIGTDLGKAVKGFKDGASGAEDKPHADQSAALPRTDGTVVDAELKESAKGRA